MAFMNEYNDKNPQKMSNIRIEWQKRYGLTSSLMCLETIKGGNMKKKDFAFICALLLLIASNTSDGSGLKNIIWTTFNLF